MTTSNSVSFLSQSLQQSSRLISLRSTIDTLQRQVTTQKKFENFSGFGTTAINLQRLHNTQTLTDTYLNNIATATNRMSLMNTSMSKISELAKQLITAVNTGDTSNMASINQLAQQNLKFVEELANQQLDGHYLFGGSNVTNQPFADHSTLNSNFVNQINTWLANPAPTANTTLLNTTDAFTATQLGLSNGLAASSASTIRIDQNQDLDYTVKADQSGFQDIIRSLAFLSNIKTPDPSVGDVATAAQLNNVLSHITTVLSRGVQAMNTSTQQLASKFNLIKSLQEAHKADQSLFQSQIDGIENADPASAIISMQALQMQLTASYQVTKIVSQMSLVNFI